MGSRIHIEGEGREVSECAEWMHAAHAEDAGSSRGASSMHSVVDGVLGWSRAQRIDLAPSDATCMPSARTRLWKIATRHSCSSASLRVRRFDGHAHEIAERSHRALVPRE